MKTVELPFSTRMLSINVPDSAIVALPRPLPEGPSGAEEVRRGLREPIGTPRMGEIVKPGKKIVLITSDITRPMPSYVVLPEVLRELTEAGIADRDITVVFGLGSHRGHTPEEMRRLVGDEVYSRLECVDSNSGEYLPLGETKLGTPVAVMDRVVQADYRICCGNIDYHYFVGYSGGAKAIMPGVSARASIQSNHKRMVLPEARIAHIDGNPVREDIEEIVQRFVPVDFIVNVVLDEHKIVRRCVTGDVVKAHRAGCRFLDEMYMTPLERPADVVLISPGGFPKDLNLYQSQKALDNAKLAVKEGGTIIWCASGREGPGEATFEKWMKCHDTPDAVVEHIKQEFLLGGHKAAAIAMVQQKANVLLYSELEPDFVRSLHLTPIADPQAALDEALSRCGGEADVLVIPYGGSTLPMLRG